MNLSTEAARIAQAVNDDIVDRTIPTSVASFSELHDYVDANDYTMEVRPRLGSEDYEAYTETVNALESEVDEWLKAGRPNVTCQIPVTFKTP